MSVARRATALVLLALWLAPLAGPARADAAGWAAFAEPGTHALMRHALAPGTGDPPGFTLGDCSTQRVLDARGRAQARRIGAAIRDAGIAVDRVLTSAWCRSSETADLLGLGPVEVAPSLNSFFADRSGEAAASAGTRALLQGLGEAKAVLVTHQVNITALTGIFPASGEMIVVAVGPDGTVEVRGRIKTE